MLPAQISAMPAKMTVSVWPRLDRPAVRAKGTVRPSAKPRVKSARKRGREGLPSHVDEEEEGDEEDDDGLLRLVCLWAGLSRWSGERGRSVVKLVGEEGS